MKHEARQQDTSALREALERIEEMWPPLRESADASAGDIARAALAALPPSAPAGLDVEDALKRLLRFTHTLTAADHEAPMRAGANLDDLFAAEAVAARLEQDHP